MAITLGKFNPNEIKVNPIHRDIKAKHIRAGRTKTKQEKLAQQARKAKQRGWE